MKYIWESHDIYAGRRVQNYCRGEDYVIGYIGHTGGASLCLICLTDGMVFAREKTEAEMAEFLNCTTNPERAYRPVEVKHDIQRED